MKDNAIPMKLSGGFKSLRDSRWSFKKLSSVFPTLFRGQSGANSGPYCYAKFVWDFAIHGGAIGTIDISGGEIIPNKAIITRTYFDVITQPVGVSGTLSFGANDAASTCVDIKAALGVASWTTTTPIEGLQLGTVAPMIRLTADRNVSVAIATTAMSAGKIVLFVEYVISE